MSILRFHAANVKSHPVNAPGLGRSFPGTARVPSLLLRQHKESQDMKTNADEVLIRNLWNEHRCAVFPKGFGGKDVSGIDFVMLDSDVAGCVDTFLNRGDLLPQNPANLK